MCGVFLQDFLHLLGAVLLNVVLTEFGFVKPCPVNNRFDFHGLRFKFNADKEFEYWDINIWSKYIYDHHEGALNGSELFLSTFLQKYSFEGKETTKDFKEDWGSFGKVTLGIFLNGYYYSSNGLVLDYFDTIIIHYTA